MSAPEPPEDATAEAPEAPRWLGPAGTPLWDAVFAPLPGGARLELRPDEIPLLTELCRLADDVEELRIVLAGEPWTAPGSKGQDVVHPLRAELHRCIATMDRLVRTLALPEAPGEASGEASGDASWAGRNLARARWSS